MLEGRDGFNEFDRWVCVTRSLGAVRNVAEQDRALECLTKALSSFPRLPPRVPPTPVLKGII